MSNLTTRILVAVVGIPLILLLTLAGGFYFFGFIALVSSLALQEYYTLANAKGLRPSRWLGLLFGLSVNAAFIFGRLREGFSSVFGIQMFVVAVLFFVPVILVLEMFRNNGSALGNTAATIAGACYVSAGFGSLIGLRESFAADDPAGAYTVIALFVSVWLCDSTAYFAGTSIGKHKLFERVSPNKTWEGAIAGFVGAIAAFVLAQSIALEYLSVTNAVICGAIVGIVGQLGDMVESLLKRDAGVKDSSSFIPGHGGVLDRFDSLIIASPFIFLFMKLVAF